MEEPQEMTDPSRKVIVVDDGAVLAKDVAQRGPAPVMDVGMELKKLALSPGDVLIVRIPSTESTVMHERIKGAARAWLNSQGLSRVRLLVLEGGIDMERVSPAYMERCGWIRKS